MSPATATQRNFLKELITEAKAKPMAGMAYGPPGIGKSSFAAAIPGCVFLTDDKEEGINRLKMSKLVKADIPVFPPIGHWPDVLGAVRQLSTEKHDHKCLVVDTIGGLERLCCEYVCEQHFKGDWSEKGFGRFGAGWKIVIAEWRTLLNLLDDCRVNGMSVMLLAHAVVHTFKNPIDDDYDHYIPDLSGKTWNLTHRWLDLILFMNYFVVVNKEGTRAKARGGKTRLMYTESEAGYEAKNRSGLPPEIDMGQSGSEAWANLAGFLKGDK